MTTNTNPAPGDQLRPTPQDCTSRWFPDCSGSATLPSPSPASRPPAPSPVAAAARDSTRASCTRAPSKQKQRRRDGRGRARALSPPRLVRHDRAPPPGRGREGRGRHPVYSPAWALSRKRSPGSGRVSAHPPAARPCVGGERAPGGCVSPPSRLLLRTSPPAFSSRAAVDPSRGRLLPDTPFRATRGYGPWRSWSLSPPRPGRHPPRTTQPTPSAPGARGRGGGDGSKLSEAYSVPHDEACPHPRHSRSSPTAI